MDEFLVDPTIAASPHWLSLVDHLKVKAFVELTLATSVREGVQNLYRFVSSLFTPQGRPRSYINGFFPFRRSAVEKGAGRRGKVAVYI